MKQIINQTLYTIMAVLFGIFFALVIMYFFNYNKVNQWVSNTSPSTSVASKTLNSNGNSNSKENTNASPKNKFNMDGKDVQKATNIISDIKKNEIEKSDDKEKNALDTFINNLPPISPPKKVDIADSDTIDVITDNQSPVSDKENDDIENQDVIANEEKNPFLDSSTDEKEVTDDEDTVEDVDKDAEILTNNIDKDDSLVDDLAEDETPIISQKNPEEALDKFLSKLPDSIESPPSSKPLKDTPMVDALDDAKNTQETPQKFLLLDPTSDDEIQNKPIGTPSSNPDVEPKDMLIPNDTLTESIQQRDDSVNIPEDTLPDIETMQNNALENGFNPSAVIEENIQDNISMQSPPPLTDKADDIDRLIGEKLSLPTRFFEISTLSSAQDKDIGIIPTPLNNIHNTEYNTPNLPSDADNIMGDNNQNPTEKNKNQPLNNKNGNSNIKTSLNNNANDDNAKKPVDLANENFTCEFEHLINSVDMEETFVLTMTPQKPSQRPITMKITRAIELYQYLNMSLEVIDNYPSEFSVLRHFCTQMSVKKSVSESY